MKPDWTTLVILIISLLCHIPAQRVFMEIDKDRQLAVKEQRCVELIEMLEKRGIEGFRWNGEFCGKCYPEQVIAGICEV